MSNFNNIHYIKRARLALKYKTTSLNILTDIISKKLLNQNTPPFPRHITLYITNRCNLNCSMCLNANYRSKNKLNKEIDLETIKKILPELKKYKPTVCISGGEPLLNPDLFKIVSLLAKNRIFVSMTTNGFLLERHAQQIANSGLEFLSVSLDHFNEKKHDKGRGVNKTYLKLITGLNKLKNIYDKTPSNIKINTVISENNFDVLSEMYDFIDKLGVDEWSLQHYNFITPVAQKIMKRYSEINSEGDYVEGTPIHTKSYLKMKQIRILQKQLDEIKRKGLVYRTKLSIKPEISNIFSYYGGKFPSKKSNCVWPFVSINIMDGSTVALCIGNQIGNLNKGASIKQMWSSKKARDFQEMILKEKVLPFCFRCCGLNFRF